MASWWFWNGKPVLIFGVHHFTDKAGSRNILQKQAVSGFPEWTYGIYWTYFCTHQWRQVASLHSMPLSWAADVTHFAQDHSCHNSPPMWPGMSCWRDFLSKSRTWRTLKNYLDYIGLPWCPKINTPYQLERFCRSRCWGSQRSSILHLHVRFQRAYEAVTGPLLRACAQTRFVKHVGVATKPRA